MLRSTKEIEGYTLRAIDGDIGHCKDFLFDDQSWVIRYMVADTGSWLTSRKVLISPVSLGDPDWTSKRFRVELTRDQIEKAPPLSRDEPVSRQHESSLFEYYGYAPYWGGPGYWGMSRTPSNLRASEEEEGGVATTTAPGPDPHLRSVDAVVGYRIQARDDRVGHVEDLILDDDSWVIRYLVIDTRNWLPGRKVLIAPDWLTRFHADSRKAELDLTREQIEKSPEYVPGAPVNRSYETRLYDFYGRPVYWD